MQTLGLGDFRLAVKRPEGEDINEWYAVNIVDFFNEISMLYSTITEFCTDASCPVMGAGACKYLWQDNKKTRPVQLSAPKYIAKLMDWVEAQLNDESIFPSQIDVPFPKNFSNIVKDIMKRLFRIYAHSYFHHLEKFAELEVAAHWNTSLKHFVFFAMEFKLIPKEQLEPLKDIIDPMLQS
jgi:MOB kinase activator 1